MSKIKNNGLDQYGTGPFQQQQFGTADVVGVNYPTGVSVDEVIQMLRSRLARVCLVCCKH